MILPGSESSLQSIFRQFVSVTSYASESDLGENTIYIPFTATLGNFKLVNLIYVPRDTFL